MMLVDYNLEITENQSGMDLLALKIANSLTLLNFSFPHHSPSLRQALLPSHSLSDQQVKVEKDCGFCQAQ
jgi:hypothetical protein